MGCKWDTSGLGNPGESNRSPSAKFFHSGHFALSRCQLDLVGGLEHDFYCPFHIWNVILPIDELIFFKMVIAPPTGFFFNEKSEGVLYPLVNQHS